MMVVSQEPIRYINRSTSSYIMISEWGSWKHVRHDELPSGQFTHPCRRSDASELPTPRACYSFALR